VQNQDDSIDQGWVSRHQRIKHAGISEDREEVLVLENTESNRVTAEAWGSHNDLIQRFLIAEHLKDRLPVGGAAVQGSVQHPELPQGSRSVHRFWFLIGLRPGLPQNMYCGPRLNAIEVKGLVIFKLPATVYQINQLRVWNRLLEFASNELLQK